MWDFDHDLLVVWMFRITACRFCSPVTVFHKFLIHTGEFNQINLQFMTFCRVSIQSFHDLHGFLLFIKSYKDKPHFHPVCFSFGVRTLVVLQELHKFPEHVYIHWHWEILKLLFSCLLLELPLLLPKFFGGCSSPKLALLLH